MELLSWLLQPAQLLPYNHRQSSWCLGNQLGHYPNLLCPLLPSPHPCSCPLFPLTTHPVLSRDIPQPKPESHPCGSSTLGLSNRAPGSSLSLLLSALPHTPPDTWHQLSPAAHSSAQPGLSLVESRALRQREGEQQSTTCPAGGSSCAAANWTRQLLRVDLHLNIWVDAAQIPASSAGLSSSSPRPCSAGKICPFKRQHFCSPHFFLP